MASFALVLKWEESFLVRRNAMPKIQMEKVNVRCT